MISMERDGEMRQFSTIGKIAVMIIFVLLMMTRFNWKQNLVTDTVDSTVRFASGNADEKEGGSYNEQAGSDNLTFPKGSSLDSGDLSTLPISDYVNQVLIETVQGQTEGTTTGATETTVEPSLTENQTSVVSSNSTSKTGTKPVTSQSTETLPVTETEDTVPNTKPIAEQPMDTTEETTIAPVLNTPAEPYTPPTIITSPYRMVGYYAAWAAYSGFAPDKIDATKLTHINYAFANVGSDHRIKMGYPDIDPGNFAKLRNLKAVNPSLKLIIAVGGWTWSGQFSDAALTDESRTIFADSCVDFIVQNGFDGVDIDWEYPVSGGVATDTKRPEDKTNFTLLMQKIREKLDAQERRDGKEYILSFAGATSTNYLRNIEPSKLSTYIDYVNLMTYDIHGSWDGFTDFNAPLYNNSDASPQYKWSVDAAVRNWLNTGVISEKIVMGVPFYGYMYKSVNNSNNGLYQSYTGSNSISYGNITRNYLNNPSYVRYYHSESKVPWLFNGSVFISYDDAQSIGLKADYIRTKNLGGAMIWELSQDPDRVLLNALYSGLQRN